MFDFSAKKWNLGAKVLCIIWVFDIFLGIGFAAYRWNFLRHAITTEATITNLIERKDKHGNTLFVPVYVFIDQQGQSVQVISSTASFPPPGEIGDKIDVFYDPESPKHSIENTFFSLWGIPAILGGLGAFCLIFFGIVAVFTGWHLKREAEQDNRTPPRLPV